MRVPGTKIYRAFEELDRFSDEQCERFLAGALRPWWRRALRWVGCVAVGFVIMVVAVAFVAVTGRGLFSPRGAEVVGLLLVTVVPLSVGALACVLCRDFLLRRRIRFVINNRASCSGCGYRLLGLPVPENNIVVCPECGAPSQVDAAMGELAVGTDGARSFTPSQRVDQVGFWKQPSTVFAVRWLKRGAYCVIVVVLLCGGVYKWRETMAYRDAVAARVMTDAVQARTEFIAGLQPKDLASTEPNAWDLMRDIAHELDGCSREAIRANQLAFDDFQKMYYTLGADVDLSVLGEPVPNPNTWPERRVWLQREHALRTLLATDAFERVKKNDLMVKVDSFVSLRRYEPWVDRLTTPGAGKWNWPDRLPIRNILNLQKGRINLAIARGDNQEAVSAFCGAIALARLSRRGSDPFDFISGAVNEEGLHERILPLLATADEPVLKRLAQVLADVDDTPTVNDVLECWRLNSRVEVAEVFADPDATKWGVAGVSPKLDNADRSAGGYWRSRPLGRLRENLDEIDRLITRVQGLAKLDAIDRKAAVDAEPIESAFYVPSVIQLAAACLTTVNRYQFAALRRDGFATLIALERFQRRHGNYPASLGELVPDFLSSLPPDPFSRGALVYRRIETSGIAEPSGAIGRKYRLYSVGANLQDDGGVHNGEGAIFIRDYNNSLGQASGDYVFGESENGSGPPTD